MQLTQYFVYTCSHRKRGGHFRSEAISSSISFLIAALRVVAPFGILPPRRMPIWWKFPNQGLAANAARLTLASSCVATLAWSFAGPVTPTPATQGDEAQRRARAVAPGQSPAGGQSADVSRWMQEISQEGSVLHTALDHVGPWAHNQTAADNDTPAEVPSAQRRRR